MKYTRLSHWSIKQTLIHCERENNDQSHLIFCKFIQNYHAISFPLFMRTFHMSHVTHEQLNPKSSFNKSIC